MNSQASSPGRRRARTAAQRELRQPKALRHQPQSLGHGQQASNRPAAAGAARAPGSRARCHHGVMRCCAASVLAGALHQLPERHAAGARRLAAAALHARLHEVHEVVGDRRVVEMHGAHRGDAAARRQRLLAGHPERRAVRQAQPAGHARAQFVVVEVKFHDAPTVPVASQPACPRVTRFTELPSITSKLLRGKPVAVSSPQGRFAADAALVDGRSPEAARGLRQAPLLLLGQRAGRARAPRPVRQVPSCTATHRRARRPDRANAADGAEGDDRPHRPHRLHDRDRRRPRSHRGPTGSRPAAQ